MILYKNNANGFKNDVDDNCIVNEWTAPQKLDTKQLLEVQFFYD